MSALLSELNQEIVGLTVTAVLGNELVLEPLGDSELFKRGSSYRLKLGAHANAMHLRDARGRNIRPISNVKLEYYPGHPALVRVTLPNPQSGETP